MLFNREKRYEWRKNALHTAAAGIARCARHRCARYPVGLGQPCWWAAAVWKVWSFSPGCAGGLFKPPAADPATGLSPSAACIRRRPHRLPCRRSLLLRSRAGSQQVAGGAAAAAPRLWRGGRRERTAKQVAGGHRHRGGALALALVLAAGGDAGQLGAAGGAALGDDRGAALLLGRVGEGMERSSGSEQRCSLQLCEQAHSRSGVHQRPGDEMTAARPSTCNTALHTQRTQRTCDTSCGKSSQ